jgi:hypothetical protein
MLLKRLFKNSSEVKFSVLDILNNRNNFTQLARDNFIETNEVEILQRVFRLSFVYKFRTNRI